MRPKAKSTIMSLKSRANNLIVLVEFLLKFTSKTVYYSTLHLKKIARIELAFIIEVAHARASFFQLWVKKPSLSFV